MMHSSPPLPTVVSILSLCETSSTIDKTIIYPQQQVDNN